MGIFAGVVAMLGLIGTVFTQAISPIHSDLDRLEKGVGRIADTAVNRADSLRDREETEHCIASVRDRLRFDEDRAGGKDDLDRVEKAIAKLVDTSATRSELEANARRTDERVNTLAGGLNDVRHDVFAGRPALPPAK